MKTMKYAVPFILAIALCLTFLAGCKKESPDEVIEPTVEQGLNGEQFQKIMQENGAYVTDMSEFEIYSFPGVFIATDVETPIKEINDGEYMYVITFFGSEDKNEIDTEYNDFREMYKNTEKTFEETSTEAGYEKYVFISERYGYNIVIKTDYALIRGESAESDKDVVDNLMGILGF